MSVSVRLADAAADRLAAWRIREQVFIREQGIAEAVEHDGLDDIAWHLVAWDGATAIGTVRVFGLGANHEPIAPDGAADVKIGRMAVLRDRRRRGIGRSLLDAALDLARRGGARRAELSAQEYVVPFYEHAGFVVDGPGHREAGIPHRRMRRDLESFGARSGEH